MKHRRGLFFGAAAALAFAAVLAFSPLFEAPWLFDDHSVIESDPAVQSVDASGRVDVGLFDGLWSQPRPLRQLTHRIDFMVFGDGASGPHVVNVALHLLVGGVGFLLLRRIGLRRETALTAVALFLMNPVCVESLGVVSHRKEILSALFLLLGAWAALSRSGRLSLPALAFFFLATCAKETAALFPVPLSLAFVAMRREKAAEGSKFRMSGIFVRTMALYAAFAFVFALLAYFQIHASMEASGGNPAEDAFRAGHFGIGTPFVPALSAAVRAAPRWAVLLMWPFDHTIDPPFDLHRPLFSASCASAAAAIALYVFALARQFRSGSRFFAPLAWCGVCLAPYLWPPLLQSGATQALADRYAYIASFGAAWLVALALESIRQRNFRMASSVALFCIIWFASFRLSGTYSSETSLWDLACRLNPRSFQAAHNHAMALWREGRDAAAAEAEFARMSRLSPDFDYGICSRAQTLAEAGNPQRALSILNRALALRPESMQLLRQRGIVHFGLGRMEECSADFAAAERLGVDDSFFRREYGEALLRLASWKEARRQFLLVRPTTQEEIREVRLSHLLVADPPARPGRVLVAGDSLPNGTAAVDSDGHERGLAWFLGRSSGTLKLSSVDDASIPGSFARDLAASVRKALRSTPQTAVCVLWSGHNDAFFGARPEEILRFLSTAALEIRKAGARPLLVGPVPVRSAPDRDRRSQERRLARLNALLRDFCMESGMVFVDARAVLEAAFPGGVDEAIDPSTGNHLLYPGMEAVARAVRAALVSLR